MPAPKPPSKVPRTLETRRLVLRELSPKDLPAMHRIFDDPAVRLHLFDGEPVPMETAGALVRRSQQDFAKGGVGLFGVRRRGAQDLIGFFVVEGVGEPELTYGLLPACWGWGFATEAAGEVARHALEEAGFRRVLVATEEANAASVRVIERLGARPLGKVVPAFPEVAYFEIGRRAEAVSQPEGEEMNAETGGNERTEGVLSGPLVEGGRIKVVRPGSDAGDVPQGVLGLDAISRQTVGSEGTFMAKYVVPPGAHSDLHTHANCETAVYVLRGRAYAYAGEDMGEYLEAGPGDFAHIPANVAHVVGCPAGGGPLEYIVTRNAPEEVVVTLRPAAELPIGPDGRMQDG